MWIERSEEFVIKVAENESERERLGREAAVLRAVAHPAIVRLARLEGPAAPAAPGRMVLHRVPGTTLGQVGRQPVQRVAGWGAAVATVLADLHELGYAHRAISPEHVLIDEQGSPILCGFGRAERLTGDVRAREGDVRALAALLYDIVPPGHDGLRRMLQRWAHGRQRRRSGARGLARSLVVKVPDASVEPPSGGHPGDAAEDRSEEPEQAGWPNRAGRDVGDGTEAAGSLRHGLFGRRAAAVTAASVVAAGFLITALVLHSGGTPGSTNAPPAAYLMQSAPGEDPVTIVGRWGCGPARPAVLDTASGTIWTFPAWPPAGRRLAGRFVEHVPAGSGLGVAPAGPGCDRLLVLRAGQPDVAVPLGADG